MQSERGFFKSNRLKLIAGTAMIFAAACGGSDKAKNTSPMVGSPAPILNTNGEFSAVRIVDLKMANFSPEAIDFAKQNIKPTSKLVRGVIEDTMAKVDGNTVTFDVVLVTEQGKVKLTASASDKGTTVTNFLGLYAKPGIGVLFGVDSKDGHTITDFTNMNQPPSIVKVPEVR